MKSFVLSTVLLASVPLLAQAPAGAPAAPPEHHHEGFQGAGMRQLPAPVANLPISAQFTSTGQMTTPDGQQRSFSGTRTVYRDSQGRVREDITFAPSGDAEQTSGRRGGPHSMTLIVDPVAGTVTRLNAERKVAVVETVPAKFFQHEEKREQHEESGRFGKTAQVTDLGSKSIAGVNAEGRKINETRPSRDGAATSTITREVWFSPEIKLEVSSTETSDRGTRTDTATSVSRGEPNASLFQVPQDYAVRQREAHEHGMHRGPGAAASPAAPVDAAPPAGLRGRHCRGGPCDAADLVHRARRCHGTRVMPGADAFPAECGAGAQCGAPSQSEVSNAYSHVCAAAHDAWLLVAQRLHGGDGRNSYVGRGRALEPRRRRKER